MKIFLEKYSIAFAVFIAGSTVMMLEIVGVRILAPYIGTSFFVWTSLIGIILGALSLGYHLGGKLADQKSSYGIFSALFFFSAMSIIALALTKEIVLEFITQNIPSPKISSILSCLILFVIPTVLLGMITPYAIRLSLKKIDQCGRKIGNLTAVSTVGSIFGTFLTGFLLLPLAGITKILFFVSLILLLTSIVLFEKKTEGKTKITLGIVIIALILPEIRHNEKTVADINSFYNRIQVFDTTSFYPGRTTRILLIGKEYDSAKFLESDELVFEYTKFYRLANHFHPQIKNALLIGGGAYTVAMDFLENNPHATIDVIEIDPAITKIAKKYFDLNPNEPRLKILHQDGRTFLNQNQKKYDLIAIDAFSSFYAIPFELSTVEATEKIRDALNENGMVITNVISAIEGDKGKFLRAEFHTYKKIFPEVLIFPVHSIRPEEADLDQNIMLIAFKDRTDTMQKAFQEKDPALRNYLGHLWKKAILADIPILTDDFAPVDNYIMELL